MDKHSSGEIKTDKTFLLWLLLGAELAVIAAVAALLVFFALRKADGNDSRTGEAHEIEVTPESGKSASFMTAAPTAAPSPTETEKAPSVTEAAPSPENTAEPSPAPEPTEDPRMNGPMRNKVFVFSSRGVKVTAAVSMPETDEPCPFVVLAHGFDGDKDADGGFVHIADALYENGIASIRIDFSGCGDSQEPASAYCLSEMSDDIVNSMSFMVKSFRVDENRAGLIGYSLGGRAVLEVLAVSAAEPSAVMLIAPAASTSDFIRLIGGQSVWDAARAEAEQNGSALLAGMLLGYDFFAQMDEREDPSEKAAAHFSGSAAVVYSENDSAVLPKVSQAVADALGCETLVFSGVGHAYGFNNGPGDEYLSQIIALAVRLFG